MAYKVTHEAEDHFVVNDGKSAFKVAKKGLGKSTLARIQAFADGGGPVQPPQAIEGAAPVVPAAPAPAPVEPLPESAYAAPDAQSVAPAAPAAPVDHSAETHDVDPRWAASFAAREPMAEQPPAQYAKANDLNPGKRLYAPEFAPVATSAPIMKFSKPLESVSKGDVASAKESAETDANPEQAKATQAQQNAAFAKQMEEDAKAKAKAKSSGKVSPQGPSKPAPESEFDRNVRERTEAVEAQKSTQMQLAKMNSDAANEREAYIRKHSEETQKFLKERMDHAEQMAKDIADSKVDPQKFWNSRTTGQKVSASIGMMLGGIGQGLMHTNSNAAVDIINRAVEQDIDSQKVDLGKRNTLLSQYMERTKDLQSARSLAKADALDAAAATLAKNAATLGGEQAQNDAKAAIANIRGNAIKERQEYAQRQAQIGLMGAQIQMQQRQLAMEEFKFKQMAQAMSGMNNEDGSYLNNPFVPKEWKETAVRLPDGKILHATTGPNADKANEVIGAVLEFKDALTKLRELQKRNAKNIKSGDVIPDSDKAEAETAHTHLVQALSGLKGTNLAGLGNQELEQFKSMVPNSADFWSTDSIKNRKLDALQTIANSKLNSTMVTRFGLRSKPYIPAKTADQKAEE